MLPNGERASDNWDLCAKDYEAAQKCSFAGDSQLGYSVVYEMIPVARDRCVRCICPQCNYVCQNNCAEVWMRLDRTLVATQVWSAVALSHLYSMEDVEFDSVVPVGREMLQNWCENAGKAENAYVYRPHQIDIAATRLRMFGQTSGTDTRGKKRPLPGSETDSGDIG